jgi:hypothetical protein
MIRFTTLVALIFVGSSQHIEYPDWDNSVRFLFVSSQEPVRAGDEIQLAVIADIAPGYHLYGPEEKKPSRTEIEFLDADGLQWGVPAFPPVVKRDLAGLGEYDLYEGEIAIMLPAKIESSKTQNQKISGRIRLHYQVCTETACSAPTSTEMGIHIPRGEPGGPVRKLYPEVFDKFKPENKL